ncbi:MAG: tyrosine-type recombinase/integrase [Clostridia bacterium]
MALYTRQTKKGKFYGVRFRLVEDGKVVMKNLSPFKTQSEAKRAEFEYRQQYEKRNEVKTASNTTFGELHEAYKTYAINNLAPSTAYDYFNIADMYFLPIFKDKIISAINKKMLSDWQDSLPSDLSYKYKKKIRTSLSSIFVYALNKDLIESNPLTNVEKMKNKTQPRQMEFWTKAEFDKFIYCVNDPLYKALFTFLYASGCRKGEAFALRWADVNFETQTVRISKSLTKKGQNFARAMNIEIKETTKNKKLADIYMPQTCLEFMKVLPRGEYVFGCEKSLSENTVSRAFNRAIQESGVKRIRMHDLRHSCAALIISTSTSELSVLYALADRLRDSVDQILKTYGHLFPSRQAEIIKTFDSLFL